MDDCVSIAIITCNRCEELKRTIESCLKYADMNIELVVVDNGSTDNTKFMLESWSFPDFCTPKLFFSNTNLGVAGGRNKAFELSSSDIVYFIDDDAYIKENSCTLKEAVIFMNQHTDVFALATEIYDTKNKNYSKNGVVDEMFDDKHAYSFSFIGASHFLRKSLVKSKLLYPPTLKYGSEEFYATILAGSNNNATVYFEEFKVVHDPSNKTRTTDFEIFYNVAVNKCVVKNLLIPRTFKGLCNIIFVIRLLRLCGVKFRMIKKGINDFKVRFEDNKECAVEISKTGWKALAKRFGYLRVI